MAAGQPGPTPASASEIMARMRPACAARPVSGTYSVGLRHGSAGLGPWVSRRTASGRSCCLTHRIANPAVPSTTTDLHVRLECSHCRMQQEGVVIADILISVSIRIRHEPREIACDWRISTVALSGSSSPTWELKLPSVLISSPNLSPSPPVVGSGGAVSGSGSGGSRAQTAAAGARTGDSEIRDTVTAALSGF